MIGRFKLDDYRHFVIEFKNNDVVIYAADHNDYPTIPLFLTPFNDIESQKDLNMDKSFTTLINNINAKYPIFKICYEEKLIITKNHKVYLISQKNNMYSIREVVIYYTKEADKSKYAKLLDKILNGEQIHIGKFLIDLETIKRCVINSNFINNIEDEETKNTISSLVDIYIEKRNSKLHSFAGNESTIEEETIKKQEQNKIYNLEDEKYKKLYNALYYGKSFNINNYNLNYERLKGLAQDESILNELDNEVLKDGLMKLIKIYKNDKRNYEEISGGSSNRNSNIKTKKAGFANNIFIMSLAGFTTGIVVTFIIIVIKKILF